MTVSINCQVEFLELVTSISQYSESIEKNLGNKSEVTGWCSTCNRVTNMKVTLGEPEGEWRNLLEGMVCECGLNGRARLVISILDEILLDHNFKNTAVLEHLTPLYPELKKRLPGLIGSEYLGDEVLAGCSIEKNGIPVRSESMMSLSYDNETLDLIMHFDVLEHIPDWRKGLEECYRVLKKEGIMMFTCPFYDNLETNIVRAQVEGDAIKHLLPEAYHGNPVSEDGSLVFIHPSWEVYNFIKSIGFDKVSLAVNYDPVQGIVSNGCPFPDGHMWPVVFVAKK